MSAVVAVLLIPAEGDPLGLLREGPCGAMPPAAAAYSWNVPGEADHWDEANHWDRTDYGRSCFLGGMIGRPCALVLAWDGKSVPEGLFRAWKQTDDEGLDDLADVLYDLDLKAVARRIAGWYRDGAPLGRLVLIDASGHEVEL